MGENIVRHIGMLECLAHCMTMVLPQPMYNYCIKFATTAV